MGFGFPASAQEWPPGPVMVTRKRRLPRARVTTAELPAKNVEAYTMEGRAIPTEKLAELLAKERNVLVALDGKKVDPFFLQIYKEGTILLVPPANTLGGAFNPFGGVEPGGVIVVRFAGDGSERKLMAEYAPVSRR